MARNYILTDGRKQIYANKSSLKATMKYKANMVILLTYWTIVYMNL